MPGPDVPGSDVTGVAARSVRSDGGGDPRVHPNTVVHLITTLSQGGAERVLSRMVPRPHEDPAERHVVISLIPGGMFAEELRDADVELRDLGMRPGRDVLRGTFRLAGMLRELRPAVVISWLYHASLLDLLARPLSGRARRARMVWSLRGSLQSMSLMRVHTRWTVRFLARRSARPEAIAINSTAGRQQHIDIGFRPNRWVHITNGCDTDRFSPDPSMRQQVRQQLGVADEALLVAFVGRDHPMKGLDLLLDALPHLSDAEHRLVVLLVGSGTQDVVVTAAQPRVIALGERTDVADLLRGADALVLPSRSEGTPNAVIEAMASAIPCVVTAVGDAAEVVGETGIVVPGPTVEGLVAGLQQLLSMSGEERRRRGAAARERAVARFALDGARSQYRGLWAPVGTEGPR